MRLITQAYLGLLAVHCSIRLIELVRSRQNQRALANQGIRRTPERGFVGMVLLHAALPVAAGLEVVWLSRPFWPLLAIPLLTLMLLANLLRWWVIATMREHWNVQVMDSLELGVVTGGPFRWVRHPNYVAVFVELSCLPLIHGAWVTAVLGTAAHLAVLRHRIRLEDGVLFRSPQYRREMGDKPRFFPGSPARPLWLLSSGREAEPRRRTRAAPPVQ